MQVERGDVVLVDFDPALGHEIAKARPAVIVQNDVGNQVAPTTIAVAITAYTPRNVTFPFCVEVPLGSGGLAKRSVVNCAHIRSIDKVRIRQRLGSLPAGLMGQVDRALKVSLALS